MNLIKKKKYSNNKVPTYSFRIKLEIIQCKQNVNPIICFLANWKMACTSTHWVPWAVSADKKLLWLKIRHIVAIKLQLLIEFWNIVSLAKCGRPVSFEILHKSSHQISIHFLILCSLSEMENRAERSRVILFVCVVGK